MNKMVRMLLWGIGVASVLTVMTEQGAQARLLGNPVTDLGAGKMEIGLGLSNVEKEFDTKVPVATLCGFALCYGTAKASGSDNVNHTTIFFDYGVSDKGMLRAEVSQAKYGVGSSSGTELGVNYRHIFSTRTLASGKVMTLGGLAGFESGSISGDNFGASYSGSYTEFQVAFGGSVGLQKGLNVYFAGVYDEFDGSISNSGNKITFTSKDPLGGYGGVDYAITADIKVGGEYHLIFEQGWAVYGTLRF